MDALFARAARLPKVPFAAPERVISQTTTAALQSGLVYGFAGQVDAIVDRIRAELGAPDAPVIATGGLADLIAPHSRTITAVDQSSPSRACGSSGRRNRRRLAHEVWLRREANSRDSRRQSSRPQPPP